MQALQKTTRHSDSNCAASTYMALCRPYLVSTPIGAS